MAKRLKSCGHKRRHPTRDGAIIHAKKILIVGMNVYRCASCGFWHVGRSSTPTRMADRIGALLARHERIMKAKNQ